MNTTKTRTRLASALLVLCMALAMFATLGLAAPVRARAADITDIMIGGNTNLNPTDGNYITTKGYSIEYVTTSPLTATLVVTRTYDYGLPMPSIEVTGGNGFGLTLDTSALPSVTCDGINIHGDGTLDGDVQLFFRGIITLNSLSTSSTISIYSGSTLVLAPSAPSATTTIPGDISVYGTLNFAPAGNSQIVCTGGISETGRVVHSGQGTTILTSNTYSDGTTVSAGTLQLGDGYTGGNVSIGQGATLLMAPTIPIVYSGNVSVSGTLNFAPADNNILVCIGVITGTGRVVHSGQGTTYLTDNNTYTGGTTVSAGDLALGNGVNDDGSITGNVSVEQGAMLTFNNNFADTTFPGVISGEGSVQKYHTSTLILTGDNTYTGGTTVNLGNLRVGDGGTTGSIQGDVVLSDSSSYLFFSRSNSVTFAGSISGAGTVQQEGPGTLTLTGTNSHAGTIISDGTLLAGSSTALGGPLAKVILGNATLQLAEGQSYAIGSLDIKPGANLYFRSGSSITAATYTYFDDAASITLDGFPAGDHMLIENTAGAILATPADIQLASLNSTAIPLSAQLRDGDVPENQLWVSLKSAPVPATVAEEPAPTPTGGSPQTGDAGHAPLWAALAALALAGLALLAAHVKRHATRQR